MYITLGFILLNYILPSFSYSFLIYYYFISYSTFYDTYYYITYAYAYSFFCYMPYFWDRNADIGANVGFENEVEPMGRYDGDIYWIWRDWIGGLRVKDGPSNTIGEAFECTWDIVGAAEEVTGLL